jgi:predicted phosphodiesterase
MAYGPIRRGGQALEKRDARPVPLGSTFSTEDSSAARPLGLDYENVFIDTGENGVFSLEEFSTVTSHEQMEFIRDNFSRTDPKAMRVLVTHHPLFALPVGEGPELGKAIGRQELALDAIGDAGVDLLLAGHNHRASTHNARDLATRAGPSLVVQAGTATSTRLRDEEQSFNRIDIDRNSVTITVQAWIDDGFKSADVQRFAAGLRGCHSFLWPRFQIAPCLALSAEHMSARGNGPHIAESEARTTWLAVGFGVQARLPLTRWLNLLAGVDNTWWDLYADGVRGYEGGSGPESTGTKTVPVPQAWAGTDAIDLFGGTEQSGEAAQKRGLAGAVGTHDDQALAAQDVEIHGSEDRSAIGLPREPADGEDRGHGVRAARISAYSRGSRGPGITV